MEEIFLDMVLVVLQFRWKLKPVFKLWGRLFQSYELVKPSAIYCKQRPNKGTSVVIADQQLSKADFSSVNFVKSDKLAVDSLILKLGI